MPRSTELKTIQDFARYCASCLYQSKATFCHGYEEPCDEATYLVMRSLGLPLEMQDRFWQAGLEKDEKELVLENIRLRCEELIPTAYIVQEWWLTGFPFYVDERVLIPRSYIAELIERRFKGILPENFRPKAIADLCTGSGCLAVLLAMAYPEANVDAIDISPEALEVAEINISQYELTDRVYPIESDLFAQAPGMKYDLIISNPPYVTTESMKALPQEYRHEPALALEAGDDGMSVITRMMDEAKDHLTDDGYLIVELGNGADAFRAKFPDLPVRWLETSGGKDQVFIVSKKDLGS